MDEPSLALDAALRPGDLETGTWLVVLRADAIPHVSLLQDGVDHSLEIDGNRRRPAAKLHRLLASRPLPALLCRLAPDAPPTVAAFFAPYARITRGGNCFLPVRDWTASWVSEAERCELAFELLTLLERSGKLARTVGQHVVTTGGRFVLPRYTARDVAAHLEALERSLG